MIPKIIHQTISDKAQLHPALRDNVQRIQAANPDWEYRLYDDAERRAFIEAHYDNRTLRLYDRISPRYGAARADFFRYLLMYSVGGVYLDVKSTVVQPLSSVISDDTPYLISFWDSGPGGREEGSGKHPKYGVDNEFQQWFIVAEPRHPYLAAVIQRVMDNIERYDALHGGVGASGVLRTTGPIAYTLAIQPVLAQYRHQVVDIHELGFRYSCLPNEALRRDRHRKIIPNYREIRFPVVNLGPDATPQQRAYHWLAIFVAYLHEASKVGGIRSRLTELKKQRREMKRASARR